MNKEVEIFKPGISALKELASKFKGLEIKGVDDEAGYKVVKDARKELGDIRIMITKFGKSKREEALAFQREVLRQEREHLEIITPLESELKSKIEAVDEEKKKAERIILLPSRKAMLGEIGAETTDEEILSLDEKQFSEMYTAKKMEHFEAQERKRKEEEHAKLRAEELEKAKEEAAKKATEEAERKSKEDLERVEREKQSEIDKIKRDQEEKDRKEKEEKERVEKEEADRIAAEKADLERAEKNRRYKKWLKDKEVNPDDPNVKIERVGNTFVLWIKADEITIN